MISSYDFLLHHYCCCLHLELSESPPSYSHEEYLWNRFFVLQTQSPLNLAARISFHIDPILLVAFQFKAKLP